jgi:hypothetical protein
MTQQTLHHHHHHGGGQCSPGCLCSSGGPFNQQQQINGGESNLVGQMCHPSSTSSQPEYNWDDLPCDPGDYSMFLSKGDSPTTSGSNFYIALFPHILLFS